MELIKDCQEQQQSTQVNIYNDNRVQVVNMAPVRTVMQTTEDYERLLDAYTRLLDTSLKSSENGKLMAQLLDTWVSKAQRLEKENKELKRMLEQKALAPAGE